MKVTGAWTRKIQANRRLTLGKEIAEQLLVHEGPWLIWYDHQKDHLCLTNEAAFRTFWTGGQIEPAGVHKISISMEVPHRFTVPSLLTDPIGWFEHRHEVKIEGQMSYISISRKS